MLLHCALCIKLKHQAVPELVPNKQEQEYLATGTDDCYRNCTPTLHETVQNPANACEVHGRNRAPNKNINPAKMRGYASKCDALLKAGEAIRRRVSIPRIDTRCDIARAATQHVCLPCKHRQPRNNSSPVRALPFWARL